MTPVIRAQFRAPNRRRRQGNILIDSGAGTTVIRKQFASDLGLQRRKERIDLTVVGGERLELMAALIASRLAQTIYEEFKIKPSCTTLCTDSTRVLNWLRSESATFKTFMGVHVAEIQAAWDPKCWRYVPCESNPADDLSRGISVKELSTGRWINGPEFLSKPKTEWPINEKHEVSSNDSEKKKPSKAVAVITKSQPLLNAEDFSSWEKLSRVTAYCLRFVNNVKSKTRDPSKVSQRSLKPEEVEGAERYWFPIHPSGTIL